MNKTTIILALALAVISCNKSVKTETPPAQIEKASWLIGSWENKSESGVLSETWTKENDSVFLGQSYFIKGKDTLHDERIELAQNGEKLIYRPTVKGQNNDKPIDFALVSSTDKQLVFANPKHDYPQKIVYTKITNDSLVADISGTQQGKSSSESYPMKKK